MVDAGSIGDVVGNLVSFSGDKLITYAGWFVTVLVVLGVLYGVYLLLQYKYNYFYIVEGKRHNINAVKKDKVGIFKQKDGTQVWKTLFSRESFKPFGQQNIYPGKTIMGVKLEKNTHKPVEYNPENSQLDIVEFDVKLWESAEREKADKEYASDDERRKALIFTGVVIFIILAALAVMVWIISSYMGGALESATVQISQLGNIVSGGAPN